MWVIYLEMGLALALLILIVWWTWPAKRTGGVESAAKEQVGKDEAPR